MLGQAQEAVLVSTCSQDARQPPNGLLAGSLKEVTYHIHSHSERHCHEDGLRKEHGGLWGARARGLLPARRPADLGSGVPPVSPFAEHAGVLCALCWEPFMDST